MSIEQVEPSSGGYDDGLAHGHNWARESMVGYDPHPVVADAGAVVTPSCVLHDDAHYA